MKLSPPLPSPPPPRQQLDPLFVVAGARQTSDGNEEAAESESTSSGAGLVNKKLVLPFIPPTFSANGEDCLIKPSEYLKSIGGSRSGSGNSFLHKTYTKCQEHKSNEPEDSKGNEANGPMPPPPPPLPDFTQKETAPGQEAVTSSKPKIQQQPLSAISIHDLNSVQLRRTTLQKTMSTPVKTLQSGSFVYFIFSFGTAPYPSDQYTASGVIL